MIGILNIDKPKGMTSSDVVVKARKILSTKAIGHFGTLDPMGEGVLVLGVGKATRLFDLMLKKDKVYEATFQFGYSTDTLDSTGKTVINGGDIPSIDAINRALPALTGKQLQMPPAYSAKSIGGKRAYELAREGKDVTLKPCEIEIYDLKAEETQEHGCYKLRIHCSSGTYVRSIGRDLATSLGTYAAMTSIRRLRCGKFVLSDSVSLEKLQEIKYDAIIPPESALSDIPKVVVGDEFYSDLLHGIKLDGNGISHGRFTLYCRNELFGVACVNESGKIQILSYLKD